MKLNTLQSLVSRNRQEIATHESSYRTIVQIARTPELSGDMWKRERKDVYKEAKNIRNKITKLADNQKELKKEIQSVVNGKFFD